MSRPSAHTRFDACMRLMTRGLQVQVDTQYCRLRLPCRALSRWIRRLAVPSAHPPCGALARAALRMLALQLTVECILILMAQLVLTLISVVSCTV